MKIVFHITVHTFVSTDFPIEKWKKIYSALSPPMVAVLHCAWATITEMAAFAFSLVCSSHPPKRKTDAVLHPPHRLAYGPLTSQSAVSPPCERVHKKPYSYN